MMRKIFSLCVGLMAVGTLMCSCGNSEVTKFVEEFQKAVAANDKSGIQSMYPDAASFELAAFDGSIDVENVEGNENQFLVSLGDGKELIVAKTDDGAYQIMSSRGLLAVPAADAELAKKTGWVSDKLTDSENAQRLNNDAFRSYINNKLNVELKDKVRIVGVSSKRISERVTSWIDDYHTDPLELSYVMRISIEVQNDLDCPIDAEAYSCTSVISYYDYYGTKTTSRSVDTKQIPANGKVTLTVNYNGKEEWVEGTGGFKGATAQMGFDYSKFDVMKICTFTGNEYDEFQNASAGLRFNLSGVMGNCGTELTFNSDKGELKYNPKGKSLSGSNLEHRIITLASYDQASGKLILEVRKSGEMTGTLDGVYRDGTYSGKFKNVSGATSSFSFK